MAMENNREIQIRGSEIRELQDSNRRMETALLDLMNDEQKAEWMFNKRRANTDRETQALVDELNVLLKKLFVAFMTNHKLILVGDVESIEKDLLSIPDVGQSIVDQVFAENSASFLHLAPDTENKDWKNDKYLEMVALAESGDADAIRALEITNILNPMASLPDALDDSGAKNFNYSNPEEGIFNGLSMDVGVHHLGFLRHNKVRDLLQFHSYGLIKWYGLEVYGSSQRMVFLTKWVAVIDDDGNQTMTRELGIYSFWVKADDTGFRRAILTNLSTRETIFDWSVGDVGFEGVTWIYTLLDDELSTYTNGAWAVNMLYTFLQSCIN
tara:strand:+ start:261 stop:1238 length:978 start_codon:yes stop_codon:yes gene_type:complete